MAKKTKQMPIRRRYKLRIDASVGSGQRRIETVFGLPKGSVRLLNRSGRGARRDKTVLSFLEDWGYWD